MYLRQNCITLVDVEVGAAVVVEVKGVELDAAPQPPDSSPWAAKARLFCVMRAALSDTAAVPVGVPVAGWSTRGLE